MGCNCGNNAFNYAAATTGAKPTGPNITSQSAPARAAASTRANITGQPSRQTGAQNITGRQPTGGGFTVPAYTNASRSTVHSAR